MMRLIKFALLCTLFSPWLNAKETNFGPPLPCEVPEFRGQNTQQDIDDYSWQVFLALNRPAKSGENGTPDCKERYVHNPKVWQTFKTSDQVFLPNGADPGPWNSATSKQLKQISKASNRAALDSNMEAVGAWLIDQAGNPTYFQMWVNEIWYDYVVSNKLYDSKNFTDQTKVRLPDGAIEIKSAWKILTSKDSKLDYITQQSYVVEFDEKGQPKLDSDGQPQTKPVLLGLVGFHQTMKVPHFPQWQWATFEHKLNVPEAKYDPVLEKVVSQPEEGVNYTYFNSHADSKKVNKSPCSSSDPNDCQAFSLTTPLTRLTPIRKEAQVANKKYHDLLIARGLGYSTGGEMPFQATPLLNYQLVTTQWPSMPDNPGATNGMPTPTISANTTMESYIQTSSNCMNCHGMATLPGTAAKSDFSFLFGSAHSSAPKTKSGKE